MRLYYGPGLCSQASHIALREAGLAFELVKVDLVAKRTEDDRDFLAISPAGYVPALEIEPGVVLTEGAAILQYVADRAPASALAPANGSVERYRLQSWLNFVTSSCTRSIRRCSNRRRRRTTSSRHSRCSASASRSSNGRSAMRRS